jgi:nucleoside-diphosphate-sugar epimerase
LLKLVDRGLPLPLAAVSNQRSMIYLGNLVDALITAAVRPEAAGQLYLVSDGETVSTPGLIIELAKLMQKRAWMWPFPVSALRFAGKLLGRSSEIERMTGSLVVDSTKIRRELQWSPPFTLLQGLQETVRWFQREY